jgi:UDP-N-acetylmuramoyl-L-alanyl-D-glutamate--2,6-diaminopimelate ligase
MLLTDLIAEIVTIKIIGNENVDIKNICADSRKVTSGDVFVAINGVAVDGHKFIGTAIENGAKVIVCEKCPTEINLEVTYVLVEDSTECLGKLASAYYDYPSEKLIIIGVTGTNGKTTIATLLYELYKELGYKVGLLSTVCNYINGRPIPSTHTTPDALSL